MHHARFHDVVVEEEEIIICLYVCLFACLLVLSYLSAYGINTYLHAGDSLLLFNVYLGFRVLTLMCCMVNIIFL